MNSIQSILSLLLLTLPFSFTTKHIDLAQQSPSVQISNLFEKRQSALTLPDCGQNCYTLALPDVGTCAEDDTACLCKDESFMDTAQQCFQTACGSEDIGIIITLGQQTCSSFGSTFFEIDRITNDLVLPAGDGIARTSLFSSPSTPVINAPTAQIDTPTGTTVLSSPTSSSTPTDSTTLSSDRPLSTNQPLQPSIFSAATSILSYKLYHFFMVALVVIYLF